MMWPSKGTKTMIKNSSEFIKHPRFPDMGCAPSQQSVSSKLLLCSRFETNALFLIPIMCTYQGCFVLQNRYHNQRTRLIFCTHKQAPGQPSRLVWCLFVYAGNYTTCGMRCWAAATASAGYSKS